MFIFLSSQFMGKRHWVGALCRGLTTPSEQQFCQIFLFFNVQTYYLLLTKFGLWARRGEINSPFGVG